VGEAEAQRELGQGRRLALAEQLAQAQDAVPDLPLAVAAEVVVPEVAVGELRLRRDGSRERALVEGHAGDHPAAVLEAGGEELVVRALVEDVVDDLEGVEHAGPYGAQRGGGVVVVDGDAEQARLAGLLEGEERVPPAVLVEETVLPRVELEDVDVVAPEVLQALLAALHDVVRGIGLRHRHVVRRGPAPVLGRHLGRHVDLFAPLLEHAADEALAVPLAVSEGGVQEGDAEVDRAIEGAQALLVVRPDPFPPPQSPGAVADLRDLQPGPAQRSVVHGRIIAPRASPGLAPGRRSRRR
jgi:hypothetical protein